MIVSSIKSTNLLKYKTFELDNIPERGVIGISGFNESGKSTIGEIICFALFGRTYSLTEDCLEKAIFWGENSCEVILEFKVEDVTYVLSRFLDKDGNHSAKLALKETADEPIVRGVKAVSEMLFDLLGFEFDEFIESFYLAQREITAPHPHSLAVKIMAGVAPLEYVIQELNGEIKKQNALVNDVDNEILAIKQEKTDMEFVDRYLPELEDSINELEIQMVTNKKASQAIKAATDLYIQHDEQVSQIKSSRSSHSFMRFLMFITTVLVGASWGLFTQKPELDQSINLLALFNQAIPYWKDAYIPYLAFGAAATAFFMIIFWVKMSIACRKVDQLKTESSNLSVVMAEVRLIEDTIVDEDDAAENESDDVETEIKITDRAPVLDFEKLYPQVMQNVASISEVKEYAEKEVLWLSGVMDRQQELFVAMESEVDVEMVRLRQRVTLNESIEVLNEKADGYKERRTVRERAIALLESASDSLSQRFNHDVRDLVAATLPLFTQQRYEHLKIDEDLDVRVFSGEKRDFLNLDEVSSGTQRQIMLALRLALSQKLMARMVKGKQFAFLDEPFAFFDEERTKQALESLNKMEGGLSQIWIVSQSFPEAASEHFALKLDCSREVNEIFISNQ